MVLTLCSHRHGRSAVIRQPPGIVEAAGAYYLPAGGADPAAWGIYDASGRLLPFAGFYRGPERHLVMQSEWVPPELFASAAEAADHDYIYGGNIQTHYGHFLLATLSRYWLLPPARQTSARIVVHAGPVVADWFAIPHIAFLFGQLGLTADNFICWDHPVRLPRIAVPEPSFEELRSAHMAFARLGHAIGEAAVGRQTTSRNDTPVYLCKSRLKSGVWRIRNEDAVADRLSQLGVDIVFPEKLDLADQIGLFQTRSRVLATVSSGLHTSILAPDCATIIGLNHDDSVVSNYSLIDAVAGNEAHYFYPKNAIVPRGGDGMFALNFDLVGTNQVAEALLRVAESKQTSPSKSRRADRLNPGSCEGLCSGGGLSEKSSHGKFSRDNEPAASTIAVIGSSGDRPDDALWPSPDDAPPSGFSETAAFSIARDAIPAFSTSSDELVVTNTMGLPEVVEVEVYRDLWPDLRSLDDETLRRHFGGLGQDEGRRANRLATRQDFLALIPHGVSVLEIGPFCHPLLTGLNVSFFDVLPQSDLASRALALGVENPRVPPISYVSPIGDLSVVNHRFNYVVSSHCIEHQPDFIRHLVQVERILQPGGRYLLLVPDKRYCFDHFIAESTLADVLDAFYSNRKTHLLKSVVEHRALTTHNDPTRHWHGDHGLPGDALVARAMASLREYEAAAGAYLDVHAWYMTPRSATGIFDALRECGFIGLELERLYPTRYPSNEFWAVLRKPGF